MKCWLFKYGCNYLRTKDHVQPKFNNMTIWVVLVYCDIGLSFMVKHIVRGFFFFNFTVLRDQAQQENTTYQWRKSLLFIDIIWCQGAQLREQSTGWIWASIHPFSSVLQNSYHIVTQEKLKCQIKRQNVMNEMNRQSREDFEVSETLWYDTIMMDMCQHTFVKICGMHNTKNEP